MPNFKNDAPGNGTKLIETYDNITMLGGLQRHQTPRSDGICPCVNSAAGMGGGQTPIAIRPGFRVRKLTPKECWRLMGFEDHDFESAKSRMNENLYNGKDRSSSQLYKQAGNSIVVDVLLHIMENLYDAMPYLFDDMVVRFFLLQVSAHLKKLLRNWTRTKALSLPRPSGRNLISSRLAISTTITVIPTEFTMVTEFLVPSRLTLVGGCKNRMVQSSTEVRCETLCINSKVNGKQPSLSNRIYDTSGVAAAVTTSDYFMPRYQIKG